MTYIWQKQEWPSFNWSSSALLDLLVKARFEQGRLLSLPSNFVHSFELSDHLAPIYKDLTTGLTSEDISLDKLHGWQASLFPTGYAGVKKIKIAEFRNKELHKSSLPHKNLQEQLQKLLEWWKEPPVELDPVLRSALSFLWFYIISPYEDGNFELSCALSELSLQQIEKTPQRTYDISVQLTENFDETHKKIQTCISGTSDITDWLTYYLELYLVAIRSAYSIADKNQQIDLFWKKFSAFPLNSRQRKVINLMLEQEQTLPGAPVSITNRKYVELCKTSRESAKRDLTELTQLGLLKLGLKKGRSVSYFL